MENIHLVTPTARLEAKVDGVIDGRRSPRAATVAAEGRDRRQLEAAIGG